MNSNPYKLSSQVASASDQQLQKMAEQYRGAGDAVSFSIVFGESQRRKETRNAVQAQSAPQPQQKVVDQAMQDMQGRQAPQQPPMPQQSGVAQLPANNMQFAGGGIVAFAQGGLTPEEEQQYGALDSGLSSLYQDARKRAPQFAGMRGVYIDPETLMTPDERSVVEAAQPQYDDLRDRFHAQQQAAQEAQAAQARQATAQRYGIPLPPTPAAASGAVPSWSDGLSQRPAVAAPAQPTMEGVYRSMGIGSQTNDTGAFDKISEMGKKQTADSLAAFDKMQKENGPAMAGLEAYLAKQQKGDVEDKDAARRMALITAGATMANSTGPVLSALGQGALAAIPGYQSEMKDIKRSQARQDEMAMTVEEGRRSEKRSDAIARMGIQEKGHGLELSTAMAKEQARMHESEFDRSLRGQLAVANLQNDYRQASQDATNANREESRLASQQRLLQQTIAGDMGLSTAWTAATTPDEQRAVIRRATEMISAQREELLMSQMSLGAEVR